MHTNRGIQPQRRQAGLNTTYQCVCTIRDLSGGLCTAIWQRNAGLARDPQTPEALRAQMGHTTVEIACHLLRPAQEYGYSRPCDRGKLKHDYRC